MRSCTAAAGGAARGRAVIAVAVICPVRLLAVVHLGPVILLSLVIIIIVIGAHVQRLMLALEFAAVAGVLSFNDLGSATHQRPFLSSAIMKACSACTGDAGHLHCRCTKSAELHAGPVWSSRCSILEWDTVLSRRDQVHRRTRIACRLARIVTQSAELRLLKLPLCMPAWRAWECRGVSSLLSETALGISYG